MRFTGKLLWLISYLKRNQSLLCRRALCRNPIIASGNIPDYKINPVLSGHKSDVEWIVSTSGVARTWVMQGLVVGHSHWRGAQRQSVRAKCGKFFRLHFLVIRMGSRGTFVLCTDVRGSMNYLFASHAPNYMHALTATDQGLRTRLPMDERSPRSLTWSCLGTRSTAVRSTCTLTVLPQYYGTKTRRSTDASTEDLRR